MNKDLHHKAAFFDLDGTLISFKTHQVLPSSIEAIHGLKAAGVMCILATGRPSYHLQEVPLDLFDAYVTLNGQYCYTKDQVLYKNPLNGHDVSVAVDHGRKQLFPCNFLEADRAYISHKNQLVTEVEKMCATEFYVQDPTRALTHDVYQLHYFCAPGQESYLLEETKHIKTCRWCDYFVDVMPDEGGKAQGCARVLDKLGIRPSDAIAFGDGENDIDMLSLAGTAIVMGNARDNVRQYADIITNDCDHDGIYRAVHDLGYI